MKKKAKMSRKLQQEALEFEKHIELLYAKHYGSTKDRSAYAASVPAAGTSSQPNPYDQEFSLWDEEDIDAEEEELDMLLTDAAMYRSKEYLGPEEEQKTCIWPGGKPTSWSELSSGYSWVGVKGTDTTCVVSTCDPVRKRPSGKAQIYCETVLTAALADMLGDTTFSFRRRIPQSSHAGPVAVVSVAPCLPGHERQQASRAINFLNEKLKDCSSLSSKETEEIAICTLMYLLGRKFNPKKIEIYGFGKYKGVMGRMSKKRVLRALKQTTTMDLTNSVASISLSST